jgi:hypothetical protein
MNTKIRDIYRFEKIDFSNPQKNELVFIMTAMFPYLEKLQHTSYLRELSQKYSRDTSWHTVRLLLLSCDSAMCGDLNLETHAPFSSGNLLSHLPDDILRRLCIEVHESFYPIGVETEKILEMRKKLKYSGHQHPFELILSVTFSPPYV